MLYLSDRLKEEALEDEFSGQQEVYFEGGHVYKVRLFLTQIKKHLISSIYNLTNTAL